MSDRLDLIESSLQLAESDARAALPTLRERLSHPDWRVRYAAAVALEELPDPDSLPALLAAYEQENAAPLFEQKETYGSAHAGSNAGVALHLPLGLSEETLQAWRRRGRLKQALCLAFAALGSKADAARPLLEHDVLDATQDPMVRAAAAKALGLITSPASLPILQKATKDEEWCTNKEATKAVASLSVKK